MRRWVDQIAARPRTRTSNRPAEEIDKLIRRSGFGFPRFRNYRNRGLIYTGKPGWYLPATTPPRRNPTRSSPWR
jgi:hypothetical protein